MLCQTQWKMSLCAPDKSSHIFSSCLISNPWSPVQTEADEKAPRCNWMNNSTGVRRESTKLPLTFSETIPEANTIIIAGVDKLNRSSVQVEISCRYRCPEQIHDLTMTKAWFLHGSILQVLNLPGPAKQQVQSILHCMCWGLYSHDTHPLQDYGIVLSSSHSTPSCSTVTSENLNQIIPTYCFQEESS